MCYNILMQLMHAAQFFFVFLIGLAVGSFVNALEWRLMHAQSVVWGVKTFFARSMCPQCRKQLAAWELLPVLSFLLLRGKCSSCHRRISLQYPCVEVSVGLFFAVTYGRFGLSWQSVVVAVFTTFLVLIFLIDLKYQLIVDAVTLPIMAVAFFLSLLLGTGISTLFLGALLGAGFFAVQYFLSAGQWVGAGDIRLGAVIGFMLGWPQTVLALMLAYAAGAVVAIMLLLLRKVTRTSRLPFGTFLTAATVYCLLFGNATLAWYRALLFLP